jgi:hypothetical protein
MIVRAGNNIPPDDTKRFPGCTAQVSATAAPAFTCFPAVPVLLVVSLLVIFPNTFALPGL